MSLKHIVAIAGGGPEDLQTLGFAAWLAAQHDSTVDILPAYPDTAIDMVTLGMTLGATLSREAIEELAAADRELHHRIDTVARQTAAAADVVFGPGEGAPRMVLMERGLRPSLSLARAVTLSDLVVIGQGYTTGAGRDGELLGQTLLHHRAPTLIARGDPDSLSGPAAIAWDGSAQAGRAVRSALPLLAMASGIYILQCVGGLDRVTTDPDIDHLNAYLKAHGVGAGVTVLLEGPDEGAALTAGAASHGAGLLVAGAYGHSRLREVVFGGATRTFLHDAAGPSLLLAN